MEAGRPALHLSVFLAWLHVERIAYSVFSKYLSMDDTNDADDSIDQLAERGEICHRLEFDPAEESASMAVVSAVGECNGDSALDLPPIGAVVDAEALDTLFGPTAGGVPRSSDRTFLFTYAEYDVRVSFDGLVALSPESTGSAK